MLDVLLNVLAVIGIIVVGGFIVVFLGNLLLNVLDSSSKDREEERQPQQTYQPEQITYNEPQQYLENNYATSQQYQEIDYAKALEEELQRQSELVEELAS
jgi:flagellar basal body-associated protein FliL